MKVLSLFDGISCARVALDRLGYKDVTYYASEVDKYAIQIAQKNWPDTVQVGDIIKLNGADFPGIDLMIGGSPCQDLSIAKKDRQGLKGARSGLFYEYVRLLKEIKPKYFVLENVNSMPKEAKEQITEILGVEPIMINAALVSAQNRKRLFWVGTLQENGTYKQIEIPQPKDRGILLKDILQDNVDDIFFLKNSRVNYIKSRPKNYECKFNPKKANTLRTNYGNASANETYIDLEDKSYCIDANYYKGSSWRHFKEKKTRQMVRVGQFNTGGQGDRIYSLEGKSVTLSANGGGRGAKTGLYLVSALTETRTEEAKAIRREMQKQGKDFSPRRMKELKPREDGKANNITTGQTKESMVLIVPVALRNRGEGKKPGYNGTGRANSLTTVQTDSMVLVVPEATKKGYAIAKNGDSVDLSFPTSKTRRGRVGNEAKNIMTSQNIGVFTEGIIRKLTPIECERLQSLPDNYTEFVSNTQRYKALGNAFNVEVVKHILSYLIN